MAKMIFPFELLIFELLGGGETVSEMIYLEPNIQRMLKSRGGRVCWLTSGKEQQLNVSVPNHLYGVYSMAPGVGFEPTRPLRVTGCPERTPGVSFLQMNLLPTGFPAIFMP